MKPLLRDSLILFIFLVVIFVNLAAGYVDTVDADPSIETAQALVENQTLFVEPANADPALYTKGLRGFVSKLGIAMPVLYIPAVLISKGLLNFFPVSEHRLIQFLISLINPVLTALLLSLIFASFRAKGHSLGMCLFIIFCVGFATFLLPYSKTAHKEPAQAVCLWLGMLSLLFPGKKTCAFLAGIGLAIVLLIKTAMIVAIFPIFLFSVWSYGKNYQFKSIFIITAPILLAVTLQASVSYWTLGDWMATGYSSDVINFSSSVWSTPFFWGIYKQVFSPHTGLFFYSPILVLSLAYFVHKMRKRKLKTLDYCVLFTFLAQLLFYACWWTPLGGNALGPRYLVPIVPLFCLVFYDRLEFTPKIQWGRLASFIVALSFVFQVVNTSVKPQHYWTLRQRSPVELHTYHWAANLKVFWHKLNSRPEIYDAIQFGGSRSASIDVSDVETLVGMNYWWIHLFKPIIQTS